MKHQDLMRVLTADCFCHRKDAHADISHRVQATHRSSNYQFNMTRVPRTKFDRTADYNRDYALVRVTAFGLGRWQPKKTCDSTLRTERGIGTDFVGLVVDVGSDVHLVKPGQTVIPCPDWPDYKGFAGTRGIVTCNASREYLRLPARALLAVDEAISHPSLAVLSTAASTAFAMVREADPEINRPVLVCGGRSSMFDAVIAALSSRNALIAVHGLSPDDSDRYPQSRVSHFVDIDGIAFTEARLLAGKIEGFSAIIDVSTNAALAQSASGLLGFGGRYVACAFHAVEANVDWPEVITKLTIRNAGLTGVHLGSRQDLTAAVDWVRTSGWKPPVGHVFTDDDLSEFVEYELATGGKKLDSIMQYATLET